jgi:hypothetical protein
MLIHADRLVALHVELLAALWALAVLAKEELGDLLTGEAVTSLRECPCAGHQ